MMRKSKIIGGKYEIISEIKKGGFGIVYYGFDRNLGKSVAIKEIAPELLEEAKYIDMFQEEAKHAAKLSHHNIVHIFDLLKTDDGHFYIIMEYVEGVDLDKINKKSRQLDKKLTLNLATFIVGEICKALEYAHNRRDVITNEPLNIVHQDISPSNIMVSMKGDVKLIDFGIAKVRYEQKANSKNIVLKGKLPYMSPEQLNGNLLIDGRSDIFSLGNVFYELITGRRLFHGANDEKTIEAVRSGKTDLKLLAALEIPGAIQKIISRALQKDREQRYQSVNQMYLDIAQYLMASSKTIELSDELSEFVKNLFASGSKQSATIETTDQTIQEQPDESDSTLMDEGTIALADSSTFAENLSNELNFKKKESQDLHTEDDILKDIAEEIDQKERSDEFKKERDESELGQFDIKEVDIKSTQSKLEVDEAKLPQALEKTEPEIPLDFDIPESSDLEEAPTIIVKNDWSSETELKPMPVPEPEPIETPEASPKSGDFSPVVISSMSDDIVEAGEDHIKTIIDVVRLSSRSHKKQIYSVLGVIGIISLIFVILDSCFVWTSIGRGIYDTLFPPAIKIISVPSGASIYLDGKLLEGKSPMSIQDISPGVHTLKLAVRGFSPITRSIQVQRKGEVEVKGEKQRPGNEPYIFRFMTEIELSSKPLGAVVYINDVKFSQLTPCTVEWEAGKPLTIEMEKKGFERLSGFTFNVLEDMNQAEDQRFWNFKKVSGQNTDDMDRYYVEGVFRKLIRVSSIPSGAEIHLDAEPRAVGLTGGRSIVSLTFGNHEIELRKEGFIAKKIPVRVDEQSQSKISVVLHRKVRLFAKDVTDPTGREIGARLVRLISKGKSIKRQEYTPCEIILPPENFEALLQKKGYKDALVQINSQQKIVVVRMEPADIYIEILVNDALTGKSIPNASVKFLNLNNGGATEQFFAHTNSEGKCGKALPQGQYLFKVEKQGYFEKRSNHKTVLEGKNQLHFKLVVQ